MSFFLIWISWYMYNREPPKSVINFFIHFYTSLDEAIYKFNKAIHPDFWEVDSDIYSESSDSSTDTDVVEAKLPPKYEDKYLDIIRILNKEWVLTEDELELKENITEDIYGGYLETIRDDIIEIQQQIDHLQKEMSEDSNAVNCSEISDEDGNELIEETTLEERNEYRQEQIKELNERLNTCKNKLDTEDGRNELRCEAIKEAHSHIVKNRINKLDNSYVMEKTPQGNVLMIYDKERESFKYYSDSSIPYRYLEVVARKYVKMFNCRPLFVDMEEELKLCDEKWTREYELKKAKEVEEKLKAEEALKNNKSIVQKKNVFAKFKNYNKDTGKNMAAPPKNSIPNKTIETKEDEKILLKERANRYTYEGKFANFNFLQKIEKKVFNKKLGFSFADFKKMQNNN